MPQTIHAVLKNAKATLKTAGVPSFSLDAELLLMQALSLTRERIIGYPETPITVAQQEEFQHLVARRANREPISHILGRREFWGREFKVTADTLDPRPDSETLIEAALELYQNHDKELKILDIGVGTGCLLLTLLAEFPNATGLGVDISNKALAVAEENSQKLGLAKRAKFVIDSWCQGIDGTFDLVVSNPPYIERSKIASLEPEVARFEPILALSGGDDGLECYRALAPSISRLLGDGAFAILEFGQDQHQDVRAIMAASGLRFVSFAQDLAGITRCIVVQK